MLTTRCLQTLAGCLLLVSLATAHPVQTLRKWTPYNDFYELQDRFASLPDAQRERLDFRFRLVSLDPAMTPDQARLVILRKHEQIAVPVDADGLMHFPRNAQYQREGLDIYTSLPRHQRLGIKAEVLVRLPEQASYRYSDLMTWMSMASNATRSRAGIWSLFMPKAIGLDVKLPAGASATLHADGKQSEQLIAGADGYVFIPSSKQSEWEHRTIRFSARPLEALPHYDKNMTLFGDGDR